MAKGYFEIKLVQIDPSKKLDFDLYIELPHSKKILLCCQKDTIFEKDKYEIVITPTLSQAVRDELKAAREAADGQEATAAVRDLINQGKIPKERKVQSGYFRILNGQKVAADAAKE